MKTIIEHEVEIIGEIEYKLYTNDLGPAVRVFDVEAQEVVTIVQYPNFDRAQVAYDTATDVNRRIS